MSRAGLPLVFFKSGQILSIFPKVAKSAPKVANYSLTVRRVEETMRVSCAGLPLAFFTSQPTDEVQAAPKQMSGF